MPRRRLPKNLTELVAELLALPELAPIERAKRARKLEPVSRALIAAVANEAVFEATRSSTHAEVAKALDVTQSRVNNAITAYRASIGHDQ